MRQIRVVGLVAVLALASCVTKEEKAPALPEAKIERVAPEMVMEATPFNVQPGGASAMSVIGANLVKGSRIKMNGMPMETASGDGTSLAAIVPPEMFAKAGTYAVTVETPDGRATNALSFVVLPKSGPAPSIKSLHPDTTAAGKPFNVQPSGIAAMGVVGANFLPGAKLIIDGKEMETSFGKTDQLAVVVKPEAFAKAGKYKVVVKNPDGKVSEPKLFVVTN